MRQLPPPEFLTQDAAASLAKVSLNAVKIWVQEGKFVCWKVGGRVRIDPTTFNAWLTTREVRRRGKDENLTSAVKLPAQAPVKKTVAKARVSRRPRKPAANHPFRLRDAIDVREALARKDAQTPFAAAVGPLDAQAVPKRFETGFCLNNLPFPNEDESKENLD